jgi:hypothetical protein
MIPRFARFLVVPALLVAGAAAAQQTMTPPPGAVQVRKACAADIQRLCPDAKPGQGGGLRMCLREHRNDLSPECRAALMAAHQQRQGSGPQTPPQGSMPQP